MGLTREEQETVIRWDREDPDVHIWSANPAVWRRMERLGISPVHEAATAGKPTARAYTLPLSQFRWGVKGRRRSSGNPETLARARQVRKQRRQGQKGQESHASEPPGGSGDGS
jgi:hypothetical protein